MEDSEASATSNSTSPPGKKAFVLGVVNASEIKCRVDRKRRWDQPPGLSEGDDGPPPNKLSCDDDTSELDEEPTENNIMHSDDLNNDVIEGIPLPPSDLSINRLGSPSSSPPTDSFVNEQIPLQTPSEVLNNLDINSTFPTTVTGSFKELNCLEANQRVSLEIDNSKVESVTGVEVIDPNSTSVDSFNSSTIEDSSSRNIVNSCSTELVEERTSNLLESETVVGEEAINNASAEKVDPDVMDTILGRSSSKSLPPEQPDPLEAGVNDSLSSPNISAHENLISEEIPLPFDKSLIKDDLDVRDKSEKSKSEPHLTSIGVSRLKALVDYDDYSDESSQQSDKLSLPEPVLIAPANDLAACENSLDSREEEFRHEDEKVIEESIVETPILNDLQPTDVDKGKKVVCESDKQVIDNPNLKDVCDINYSVDSDISSETDLNKAELIESFSSTVALDDKTSSSKNQEPTVLCENPISEEIKNEENKEELFGVKEKPSDADTTYNKSKTENTCNIIPNFKPSEVLSTALILEPKKSSVNVEPLTAFISTSQPSVSLESACQDVNSGDTVSESTVVETVSPSTQLCSLSIDETNSTPENISAENNVLKNISEEDKTSLPSRNGFQPSTFTDDINQPVKSVSGVTPDSLSNKEAIAPSAESNLELKENADTSEKEVISSVESASVGDKLAINDINVFDNSSNLSLLPPKEKDIESDITSSDKVSPNSSLKPANVNALDKSSAEKVTEGEPGSIELKTDLVESQHKSVNENVVNACQDDIEKYESDDVPCDIFNDESKEDETIISKAQIISHEVQSLSKEVEQEVHKEEATLGAEVNVSLESHVSDDKKKCSDKIQEEVSMNAVDDVRITSEEIVKQNEIEKDAKSNECFSAKKIEEIEDFIKMNSSKNLVKNAENTNALDVCENSLELEPDSSKKNKLNYSTIQTVNALIPSENNSIQSLTDLNMDCESIDTVQSVESTASLSVLKEDSDLINSNSVIDISSDSSCGYKKDKSSLSFDISSISNNNKKASDVSKSNLVNVSSVPLSDDDNSSIECISSAVKPEDIMPKNHSNVKMSSLSDESKSIESPLPLSNIQPDVISVPDSDSSNSKIDNVLSVKSAKQDCKFPTTIKNVIEESPVPSNSIKISGPKMEKVSSFPLDNISLVISNEAVCNSTRRKHDGENQKASVINEPAALNTSHTSSEPMDVCETPLSISTDENAKDDSLSDPKNEPITLRIFKDNNALHSESRDSPKRPRLDDSPKQLEFTLKISKDASTNIPKATMSPKRTQSPQRIPDPVPPRISSEVSITPVLFSPTNQKDKKTGKKPSRFSKVDSSTSEQSEVTLSKVDVITRVSKVESHVNNIPKVNVTDLNNCNDVREADKSIIEIKNEFPSPMVTPVNTRGRGGRRGKKDVNPTPGPPRRRGRPPKRPVEITHESLASDQSLTSTLFSHLSSNIEAPSTLSPTDTPSSRPVRECRDRTKPILLKQRKPRGGGNSSRGRGGGRGGARTPLLPGREALSAREQEELDRIEARNQQIRLEKLAKREAKLAKKAKRAVSIDEEPEIPPRELTEEEKLELAAKREAEERARAERAARAAVEAERRAAEAAAAKEAEKLAKIAARRERLRELHRLKRDKILAKKAAKKLKDEERRKRKAAEKAAEQAAALQSMYEDETRMSAPDGSLRPLFGGDETPKNKSGRMEINLNDSKEVSVEQLAEYQWEGGELYMIQEQVAEYLGVKSFKRKYPDLKRRPVDAEERKYLEETSLVPKSLCDLGITAVSSSEVLDVMYQDFPDKYEEVRRHLREKQMKEISSKQRALSLYSKQSDKAKADLREQALECAATWNAHLNRERREERKCSMDLQSFIIHYPLSKRETMKKPVPPVGNYPVAVLPGQYCDYYKKFTSNELMYFPLNTVLYGPLKPNERHIIPSDASQSESEETSSSSESCSSSDDSDSESDGDDDVKCKICNSSRSSRTDEGGGTPALPPPAIKPEIFLPCTKCKLYCHPTCCKITGVMIPHVRKYDWMCISCKVCVKCNSTENQSKMRLCDLCDRGFHISCLDPRKMVPEGNRWHCAVCSFCWSCSAREPGGPSKQWLHEFIKDESGEKVYQRSLCATCCAKVGREAAAAAAAAAAVAASQQANTSGLSSTTKCVNTIALTPTSTEQPGPSGTPTTPVRGYQVLQTKEGTQVMVSYPEVRVALSRSGSSGSVVVRSGAGGTAQSRPQTPKSSLSDVQLLPPMLSKSTSSPHNSLSTLSTSINFNTASNAPKK